MDNFFIINVPFVNSVFHPSDFSPASENAFAHALAIALIRKTKFTILHVGGSRADWRRFPAVRTTLERWGLLEKGSPKSAVFEELAVRVKKVNMRGRNPLAETLDYLNEKPTDLIVLATEGREGLPRWIQPSVAERLAEKTGTKTLFVPDNAKGFVSLENGEFSLRRILVPLDHDPDPVPAIEYATRIAKAVETPVEIDLLHIGDTTEMPTVDLPDLPNCTWKKEHRQGEVVDEIINDAKAHQTDLIIMPTAGHEGILDAIRGSVTEQVLRRAPCPLAAVPM